VERIKKENDEKFKHFDNRADQPALGGIGSTKLVTTCCYTEKQFGRNPNHHSR
jgi:hypothetical protein